MIRLVFVCLLAGSLAHGAEKELLPVAWHGNWQGSMLVYGRPNTPPQRVALGLNIAPVPEKNQLTWTLQYGEGDKKSVRPYVLIRTPQGQLQIDEQNGIVLDVDLTGNVIYSQFEVNGSLLTARYELRDKELLFEIVSAQKGTKSGTKQLPVQSFAPRLVQSGTMQRKEKN